MKNLCRTCNQEMEFRGEIETDPKWHYRIVNSKNCCNTGCPEAFKAIEIDIELEPYDKSKYKKCPNCERLFKPKTKHEGEHCGECCPVCQTINKGSGCDGFSSEIGNRIHYDSKKDKAFEAMREALGAMPYALKLALSTLDHIHAGHPIANDYYEWVKEDIRAALKLADDCEE